MYDTLHFFNHRRLNVATINDMNLSAKSAKEGIWESGNLENLRIITKPSGTTIKGSIAKFAIGNNVDNLVFRDVRPAIELLSDFMNNDVSQWQITRLDTAATLQMENAPEKYINRLLSVDKGVRYTYPDETTYFQMAQDLLLFYDKKKELRKADFKAYTDKKDLNLLRYETQIKSPIKAFKRQIIGKDLWSRDFQMEVLNRWRDNYFKIKKIKKSIFKMDTNPTNKDLLDVMFSVIYNSLPFEFTENLKNEITAMAKTKQKKWELSKKIEEIKAKTEGKNETDLTQEMNQKIEKIYLENSA